MHICIQKKQAQSRNSASLERDMQMIEISMKMRQSYELFVQKRCATRRLLKHEWSLRLAIQTKLTIWIDDSVIRDASETKPAAMQIVVGQ